MFFQKQKSVRFILASVFALMMSHTFAVAQQVGNVFTDEVIVTAQKREQNLQDVGIAVTAVSGEQMQALGYTNAQEIIALAPGVSLIQPNGEANYAIGIRGVANNDFTTNVESPIAIYVDEVYISQMSGAGFMLFDMERAEILRGPQGTLFGRNATGGLVQYVTVRPSSEMSGYGSLAYGEFSQLKFQGGVNVPLTDRFSLRISGATHQRDGYVTNRLNPNQDLNNANEYGVRLQALYEGEDWEALLNLRQGRQDIRTGFFQHISAPTAGMLTPSAPNPYLNDADGEPGYIDNDDDVYAGDYDFLGHNDLKTEGVSLTLKGDMAGLKFTSITDFSKTYRDYIEDSDASPENYFNFFLTTDAEQITQELRLEGEADKSRWVVGAYYLDLEVDDSNGGIAPGFISDYYTALCSKFITTAQEPTDDCYSGADALIGGAFDPNLNPPSGFPTTVGGYAVGAGVVGEGHGIYNPYQTNSESLSIFGQYEHDFANDLTLIVGARYITEEKDHYYRNLEVNYDPLATSGKDPRTTAAFDPDVLAEDLRAVGDGEGSVFAVYRGDRDDSEWAGRLQLDWRPMEDTLYYISYNRGVKSGGFNAPLLPTVDSNLDGNKDDTTVTDLFMSYDPEQLDAFEIGFKRELNDGRLTINGAAFYYDYNDYQAFAILGLDTFTLNAEAESYGAELEIQASPLSGLDLLFGIGYVDTEVTKVPGVNENRPGILLATVEPADLGRPVSPVQTPELNLNALIRYETPVAGMKGNIAFQLAAEYRDEHYFNLTNSSTLTEDGYTLLNGSIAYFPMANQNVSMRLGVSNLTDEEYIVQGFDLSGTILDGTGFWGMTEHYYGRPRTWSLSVHYMF